MEQVSEAVMASNTLTLPCTVHCVVAQLVTRTSAGRARSISSVNWMAETVAKGNHKLCRLELQTETRRGDDGEPSSCMGILDAYRSQSSNVPNTALLLNLTSEELQVERSILELSSL